MDMIPYRFSESGYEYTLLSVESDFSKHPNQTLVSAEYENQYGHLKTLPADVISKLDDRI